MPSLEGIIILPQGLDCFHGINLIRFPSTKDKAFIDKYQIAICTALLNMHGFICTFEPPTDKYPYETSSFIVQIRSF